MNPTETKTTDAPLRAVVDEWTAALRARDLDRMMALYTPGVVFFDGIAPLQIDQGTYRKNWEGYFKWFPGPVGFEMRHLKITAGDRAAFLTALVHLKGTNAEGKEEGGWMRYTAGFERTGGRWMISHEHWSMPMDMETGKVVTTLEPD